MGVWLSRSFALPKGRDGCSARREPRPPKGAPAQQELRPPKRGVTGVRLGGSLALPKVRRLSRSFALPKGGCGQVLENWATALRKS